MGWGLNGYTNGIVELIDSGGNRHRYTDPNEDGFYKSTSGGNNALLKHDDDTWTEFSPFGRRYRYDATGRLFAKTIRTGSRWTATYDSGKITSISDPYARRMTFVYDANGKIRRIHDVAGRITTYMVDANRDLTKIISPVGCQTEFIYDDYHAVKTHVHPSGRRTSFTFGEDDKINVISTPDGERTTYTYFEDTSVQITNPLGQSTEVLFNDDNLIKAVINPLSARSNRSHPGEQ